MPEEPCIYEARWEKDPITSFEVDTQEDIPGELEAFIRLNRLGRFSEAKAFFEETLRPHVDQFPVFIEYADLLLEQGNFRSLSEFLGSASKKLFTKEETILVDLLNALAEIYVDAAWQSGLAQACLAWDFLHSQSLGSDGLPSDVQMHIIEVYVAIIALKIGKSGLAEASFERPGFPWKPWSEMKGYWWTPFHEWYTTLQQRGLSWEANKILRLLLPSLNIDEVAWLIPSEELNHTVESVDSLKPSEPALLTVLTVANDILRYAVASFHRDGIVGTMGLLKFVAPYYEVATRVVELIFGPEPNDSQGRLVIQWKLAAEQMTYLKNAGMIDLFELHPLFIRLEMAAISLEDIKLQAELIPAVCWTDSEIGSTSSTPPFDASPIIGANWDLTLLAAPLHALMVPSSGAGLEKLEKVLWHRPPGWDTAKAEVWNLLLLTANDDQRHELLLNLTKISAEGGPQTRNDSPALQLANILLAQSPNLVSHKSSESSSVFHKAAQFGAIPILEIALKADERRVEEFLSTPDFTSKTPLDYAVENNQAAVIAKLLSLGYKLPISRANLHELARHADPNVVEMMAMLSPDYVDVHVVQEAIERGRSDVARVLLQIYKPESPKIGAWENLLPLAVQKRQTDVVEMLVSKFPESTLKLDEKGRSVLWHNKPSSEKEAPQVQQMIRDWIAPVIIRNAPIAEAKRALGEGGELCLDLRNYKDFPEGFSRFVDSISQTSNLQSPELKHSRPSFNVAFESTLKYVHIPIPDRDDDPNILPHVRVPRDEVNKILRWLSLEKGVKKIMELRVIDSERKPHDEEKIADAVREFDIEILDWNRPDLSIDCIVDAAPKVKELHLYSWNWTSLSQWTGDEGAIILTKLKVLHITVLQASISEALANKYLQRAEERMARLTDFSGKKLSWVIKLSRDHNEGRSPLEVTRLGPFLQGYTSLQQNQHDERLASESPRSTRTKIAILGDGINQTSPVWREASKSTAGGLTGASFVFDREGNESSWWLSRTCDGTHLAGVIRQLDPFCELFIAKVIEQPEKLDLDRIISAIKWAMKREVDIIVIDLEIPESTMRLDADAFRQLIFEASSNGINFLVSMRDDIRFHDAQPGSVVTVAEYASHKALGPTKVTGHLALGKIFCDGKHVTVPGLMSEGVKQQLPTPLAATAIAAGVASLILATQRLVQFSIDPDGSTSNSSLPKLLEIMERKMGGQECLRPWRWFGEKAVYEIDELRSMLEKTKYW